MVVYYKFKSAREYDSIPMDGSFISIGILKEKKKLNTNTWVQVPISTLWSPTSKLMKVGYDF